MEVMKLYTKVYFFPGHSVHYDYDHMLTLFSLHVRSRLQHLLFAIHWIC